MQSGASTPEELEALLEDAFVIGDRDAVAELFHSGAVLVADGAVEARGSQEIGRYAAAMCDRGYSYIADPRRVLQARDTTLVLSERGVNVMRRGQDGRWRYAISLLNTNNDTTEREIR
jgi:ketosteroid isomerase-like protein